VARMLGAPEPTAAAPAPDVVSRLALRGIVTHGSRGAALIAVDGKPAKPVRVGAPLDGVEGGWKVQAVEPRAVVLAADGRQARLEMPKLSERSRAGDAVAPMRPALPAAPQNLSPPSAPPPQQQQQPVRR
ncbi:type II secretion system protein N, partial [Ottowia sp.]|uniref:type II secretion system protein N n=1 Tax=Ottowia sp. TaxID=1898956 RepID=UPI0039E6C34D